MIDRDLINSKLTSINRKSKVNSLNAVGDTARIEREATEGATIGLTVNQTVNGFTSITASTNENKAITTEPSVARMSDGVPGLTLTKTSSKTSEITTLTGKTASNGFLNATITHASPKAIGNTLTNVTPATVDQVKSAVAGTSANPQVASSLVNVNVADKVTNNVKTVAAKANKELSNPFGSIGAAISSAGTSFGNVLGNLIGTITGSIKRGSTAIVGELPAVTASSSSIDKSLPATNLETLNSAVNNVNNQLSSAITNITETSAGAIGVASTTVGNIANGVFTSTGTSLNAVEELPPIITSTGNTNIRNVVEPTKLLPDDVKPTTVPYVIGQERTGWAGAYTPTTYEFTYVNSYEELELELRNTPRDITTVIAAWTKTPLNVHPDVHTIHKKQVSVDFKRLTTDEELTTRGGVLTNYFIHRDGSIQRGRPISVEGRENTFLNYSITVSFMGGVNGNYPEWNDKTIKADPTILSADSLTVEQWKSWESFATAFVKAIPGAQFLGMLDISETRNDPGFYPAEWAKDTLGVENLYIGNDIPMDRKINRLGAFSPYEINKKVPSTVSVPTVTARSVEPKPAPVAEDVANTTTGVANKKTLDENTKFQIEYDELQRAIGKNKTTLLTLYNSLSKLQYGSAERNKLTESYQTLEAENKIKVKRSLELEKILSKGFNRTEDTLTALNQAKAVLSNAEARLERAQSTNISTEKLNKYTNAVSDATAEVERLTALYDEALLADRVRDN